VAARAAAPEELPDTRILTVDSDLAESVQALKKIFEKRFIPANFGKNDDDFIGGLKRLLSLTDRYARFLQEADPVDVETVTPPERVRFVPAAELEQEQSQYTQGEDAIAGWHKGWVVVAQGMLGDPYFIDTAAPDAEGDCPVMTTMSGSALNPVVCASSFASFIQILATAMEIAEDFADDASPDEEHIFREALAPKLRVIDHIALRERHWTN
jgi:hypothetical protein